VKGIPSSKHLAERSEYFRQKVWALKQRALGVAEPPVLPVAAETPSEQIPTLVAMRTKEQSSKCCPPGQAGDDNRGNA
jgi:1-acyl-sn-glycerol-3-phosphate acyltransferase